MFRAVASHFWFDYFVQYKQYWAFPGQWPDSFCLITFCSTDSTVRFPAGGLPILIGSLSVVQTVLRVFRAVTF